MSDDNGVKAATSHHLGQNFSKMFDISFEDPETHEKCFAYQNSWAITTRSIGVLIMVHGDNKGLVLPPRIAVHQCVIVPCGITASLAEAEKKAIVAKCEEVEKQLTGAGIRVKGDYRDNYSPGWKFNHWELKGVPLRIEIGARDIQNQQMVLIRRDTGEKSTIPWAGAAESIQNMLDTIQKAMFNKAKKELDENMIQSTDFEHFCDSLNEKKILLSPFCGAIPCEEYIKKASARDAVVEEGAPAMGAKGLCIPFNQPSPITPDMKCICPNCDEKPKHWTLFGRSY